MTTICDPMVLEDYNSNEPDEVFYYRHVHWRTTKEPLNPELLYRWCGGVIQYQDKQGVWQPSAVSCTEFLKEVEAGVWEQVTPASAEQMKGVPA